MNRLFVDTSAWAALADSTDANHELAVLFRDEAAGKYRLITTNYILDELYTLLLMNVGYLQTVTFKRRIDFLTQQGTLQIIWILEDTANNAWRVFEQFNVDKHWSFTDCVSYVVMQQRQIIEAFTFDRHFAQMGFITRP